jgi:hypothetical protein
VSADAELVARAAHARAEDLRREASKAANTGELAPFTRADLLRLLASQWDKFAAGISTRLGQESDLS